MYKFYSLLFVGLLVVSTSFAHAANSSGLVNGVWFSQDPVTDFKAVTVYSVVHNQTDTQIQGIATLVVDGEAVKASEVSIGSGDIKRVGIKHTFSVGSHTVGMNFTAGNATEVTHTELSKRTIFVVQDTDGDGIQNTTDPDDDNDGIPDVDDADPLVKQIVPKTSFNVTESGKALLDKIVNRTDTDGETKTETPVVENNEENVVSTSTLLATLKAIEETRKKTAELVQEYEEKQREALDEIVRNEQKTKEVEGFEEKPEVAQESKKREHQIAAAGASIAGTMLEKAWIFYAEVVVLTLGALHLLWVSIRNRFFRMGVEDEE